MCGVDVKVGLVEYFGDNNLVTGFGKFRIYWELVAGIPSYWGGIIGLVYIIGFGF